MEADNLEKRIRERKEKIGIVLDFIEEAIRTFRKDSLVDKYVGNSNTHVVYEFEFGGFFFRTSYGECMMGGNTISVWEGLKKNNKLIFKFWYQTDREEGKVEFLDTGSDWLSKLENIISNKEKVLSAERQEEESRRERALLEDRQAERLASLRKEAQRWAV